MPAKSALNRDLIRYAFSLSQALQQRAATFDLLVQLRHAGVEIDPRAIRALTAADVVSAVQSGVWSVGRTWTLGVADLVTAYGSQAAALKQRAATNELLVQLVSAGCEINPQTIRALTSADEITVYGALAKIAQRAVSFDAYVAVRQGGSELSNSNPLPVTNVVDPATAVPTGAILAYGGTSAPPEFLLCDGSEVSRTVYAALFGVIGTAYGVGNGSTTFNLPDLRQKFPLGKAASGTGNILGESGGFIDHTHAIGTHHHEMPIGANDPNVCIANYPHGTGGVETSKWRHGFDRVTESFPRLLTEDNAASETGAKNPPFQTVNYIIKT